MRAAPPNLTRDPLPADLTGKHVAIAGGRRSSDELFFMRFAPMLKARGADLSYRGDPDLTSLMGRGGVFDDPREPDFTVSSGDLPFVIEADAAAGTLRATPITSLPERRNDARDMLQSTGPGLYIRVTWRAGPDHPPLDGVAAALASVAGDVILLQADPSQDEIDRFEAALGRNVTDLAPPDGDIEALLALMGLLDEYVCVDNINMHLRAARGRGGLRGAGNPGARTPQTVSARLLVCRPVQLQLDHGKNGVQ